MGTTIPAFAIPFRFSTGPTPTPLVVQQDSDAEIQQCVDAVLSTIQGDIDVTPTFGIADPRFSDGVNAAQIQATLALWEPRAFATVTDDDAYAMTGWDERVTVSVEASDGE